MRPTKKSLAEPKSICSASTMKSSGPIVTGLGALKVRQALSERSVPLRTTSLVVGGGSLAPSVSVTVEATTALSLALADAV